MSKNNKSDRGKRGNLRNNKSKKQDDSEEASEEDDVSESEEEEDQDEESDVPARRTSGRRGRPPGKASNIIVKQRGRAARSSTRSGPNDLDKYAHKPLISRAERSRMRNMKKGWDESEEEVEGSLRDD